MAEIIINVLQPQGASLSEENIKLRNSFLDHLLDHIYDNNTFVRSRVGYHYILENEIEELIFILFSCIFF